MDFFTIFVLLLLLGSVLLFGVGLSFILGAGWAQLILDFLTGSTTGGYEGLQQWFPAKPGLKRKALGVLIVIASTILFFWSIYKV